MTGLCCGITVAAVLIMKGGKEEGWDNITQETEKPNVVSAVIFDSLSEAYFLLL